MAFAVIAALAAGVQSAGAVHNVLAAGLAVSRGAVHNARYCLRGGSRDNCSFNTWKKCMAAARGHNSRCVENPRLHRPNR
ncbi:MAG TPA: DUF3551 domain-containing protein [Xanthobacteraceae bacterium]|jgi:hypothetical protein